MVFSTLTVASPFALGLLLAMVFDNERMRGKKIYRMLMIIPYALPTFMTILVWRGMINETFGILNEILPVRRPVAQRRLVGQVLGAARQPLAGVRLHVPRVHGSAAEHPDRSQGGGLRRRRDRASRRSRGSRSRCC